MKPAELVQEHPRVFHMAWEGSWPSIQRHGLLSTAALLDRWGIEGEGRQALLEAHRPESVPLQHPEHGTATVRDQKPMSDSGLRRCLMDGLEPRDWYRFLNERVFFWATRDRLEILLGARAYRDARHTVLTVDTAELVGRHAERIELTTMNTGCTVPFPFPRGLSSFAPLFDFDYTASRRKRGRAKAIAEVVIREGVADLAEFVIRAEHRGGAGPNEVLYERV